MFFVSNYYSFSAFNPLIFYLNKIGKAAPAYNSKKSISEHQKKMIDALRNNKFGGYNKTDAKRELALHTATASENRHS